MKYLSIICFITAISACQQPSNSTEISQSSFFDLDKYFEQQISHNEGFAGVNKIVGINQKTENKELKDIDWKEALSVFQKANINKPAWSDKYQTDTLKNNELTSIIYTAIDSKLLTDTIIIKLKGEEVHQIRIQQSNTNAIYNSKKTLDYFPNKGYIIKNQQQTRFSKEQNYLIKVDFLK